MKFENPAAILKPNEPGLEVGPGSAEGDWINRINLTINNFKELIKLAQQFRGKEPEEPPGDRPARSNPNPPARSPGLIDYIRLAIQAGYGDTPIGELFKQASPYTLKQIVEIIKNVGSKR